MREGVRRYVKVGKVESEKKREGLEKSNDTEDRLWELAAKNRLPAIYTFASFVDAGGLMS